MALTLAAATLGASAVAGVGSLIGGWLGYKGQESANAQNERLANTQYQRGMADMRAAGLNPIYAYGGSGASSPTMQNSVAGGMDAFNKTSASVAAVRQNAATMKKLNAETIKLNSETNILASQEEIANNERLASDMDWKVRREQQPGFINLAKWRSKNTRYKKATEILEPINSLLGAGSSAAGIYRSLKR